LKRSRVESQQASIDRLHREITELQASRTRLVLAADAERRAIERALHEGVQQHLVALAVNLQVALGLVDSDHAAAKALLERMQGDVQCALDEAALLAQRIYPPLLDASTLAAALRADAATLGTRVSVVVDGGSRCPPEAVWTVYLCCLAILEQAGEGARTAISVRETPGALVFEIAEDGPGPARRTASWNRALDPLRDRVEAVGGRLSLRSADGDGTRVSGSLPLGE
jgi:signal transduction histidine kinase